MTELQQPSREAEFGASDLVVLAAVRAAFAGAGLLIIALTPDEPARLEYLTYGSLVGYVIYSVVLLGLAYLKWSRQLLVVTACTDVLFAGYLVALTEGTNSIFYFCFFVAIVAAAFDAGFRAGIAVTCASVVLFVVSGIATSPYSVSEELDRTLIRPIALFAIGCLISYFGGRELLLRRRLEFLAELGAPGNPRAGPRRLIESKLASLCEFFEAGQAFLAVEYTGKRETHLFHHSARSTGSITARTISASEPTVRRFIEISEAYSVHPEAWHVRWVDRVKAMLWRRGRAAASDADIAALANFLETGCIVTSRYVQGEDAHGRLVLARRKKRFSIGEARFLRQCATALGTVVAGASLTEELVAHAAEFERSNISRDLHDTTIQPFIGLRMAAHSIAREFHDDERASVRLRQLAELADQAIEDLRYYTRGLVSGRGDVRESLGEAVRRQAARLQRFYDVEIEVQVDERVPVSARVAEAAFHIVCEGLNNVVRHTRSGLARVALEAQGSELVIDIRNRHARDAPPPSPFEPRSIAERVAALGGTVELRPSDSGYTILRCTLPLEPAQP